MSQILFVQQSPPHGSIVGQEGLDACLMGSAFADCALLFLGDGIYQIMGGQNTEALGLKDYSISYGVLPDYGVTQIFCCEDDLIMRDLTLDDLCLATTALSSEDVASLVRDAQQVLTF